MSEEVARAVVNGVSSSEEEEDGDEAVGENLVFAPDSSDDEELEEEVEREIQFDESDSDSSAEADGVGQEEFDFMRKQEEKMVSLEEGPLSSPSDNESKSEGRTHLQRVASLSSSDGEEKPVVNVVEAGSKPSGVFEESGDAASPEEEEKAEGEEKAEEEVEEEEESHTEQPTNNFKASPDNVKELSVTGLPGSELGGPSNIEQYQARPSNIEEGPHDFDGKDQYEDTPSLSSSDSSPVIGINSG